MRRNKQALRRGISATRPPASDDRRGRHPRRRSPIRTAAAASRYPVGWRTRSEFSRRDGPGITDEEWVAMGGELSDEEYNARFKRYFGIDL